MNPKLVALVGAGLVGLYALSQTGGADNGGGGGSDSNQRFGRILGSPYQADGGGGGSAPIGTYVFPGESFKGFDPIPLWQPQLSGLLEQPQQQLVMEPTTRNSSGSYSKKQRSVGASSAIEGVKSQYQGLQKYSPSPGSAADHSPWSQYEMATPGVTAYVSYPTDTATTTPVKKKTSAPTSRIGSRIARQRAAGGRSVR